MSVHDMSAVIPEEHETSDSLDLEFQVLETKLRTSVGGPDASNH